MTSSASLEQILAEGQRLLQAEDKARASTFFAMATQMNPRDKNLWRLRAETAQDPLEAVECWDQVLALDPGDEAAREQQMLVRMNTLQAEAKTKTPLNYAAGGDRASFRGLAYTLSRSWIIGAGILVIALCLILGLGIPILAVLGRSDSAISGVEQKAPTTDIISLVLPATWTPSPTRTPIPTFTITPTPIWKATRKATVRAGPGANYATLGTLVEGSIVVAVGRNSDNTWLQIQFPDATKLGWVQTDFVGIGRDALVAIPTRTAPTATPAKAPTVKPTLKPTDTPVPVYDFILGRPVEFIADCARPWKVAGTVYDTPAGAHRLNGILIRLWAYNQLQGTITTGSADTNKPGYWEWTFSRGVEIQGQVAVVNGDGSLRSAPVSFYLTGRCDGTGATNQMIIDFTGK